MRRISFAIIPLLAGIAVGCNDKSAAPPTADPAPAAPAHAAPTTQELLTGPRKLLALPMLGLSVRVPESWSLDASDPKLVMLQGPAPGGDLQIQLSSRPPMNADQVESIHTGMEKDAATDPRHIQVPDIRVINSMKVLEMIEIPEPTSRPSVQRLITWNVTFYIPDGDMVLPRNFNFIDLTPEQYASDGTFLRSILDSLVKEEPAANP